MQYQQEKHGTTAPGAAIASNWWQEVLEATSDCVAAFAVDGRLLYLNSRWREVLGLEAEGELGEWTFQSLLGPQWRQQVLVEAIPAALRDGLWRGDGGILDAKGAERTVSKVIVAHRDAYGETRWLTAVARECDHPHTRKLSDQLAGELIEQQTRLDAVLSAIPCGVMIVEPPQCRVTYVNCQAAEMFGLKQSGPAAYESDQQLSLLREDGNELPLGQTPLCQALKLGQTITGTELSVRLPDGRRRVVLAGASPIRDCSGRIVAAVGVFDDITLRRGAEDALRQSRDAMEQEVARRTEDLRRMALELTKAQQRDRRRFSQVLHDHLQQLMTGAKFSLRTLAGRCQDNGALGEQVRDIEKLVDECIGASRSLTCEMSPTILYDAGLAAGLEWLVRQMRQQYGLEVEAMLHDGAADGLGDEALRVLLFDAVRELLRNVLLHSRVHKACLEMWAEDGQFCLEVRDEGVGFQPSQDPPRLAVSGAGMGLFAIRERMTALGGRLEVQTGPGQGTCCTICLPLDQDSPAEQAGSPAGPTQPAMAMPPAVLFSAGSFHAQTQPAEKGPKQAQQCIRILLADDHSTVRRGLALLLEEEPDMIVVAEAANGREAVDLALHHRPDVIVMDMAMPVLNGLQATRMIRKDLPAVRVIGLSMFEAEDMAERMLDAGADTYLTKSGPATDLLAAIRGQARES